MRLTVVGSGGGTGVAAEASAAYLLTSDAAALLVECGPGIATAIPKFIGLNALTGVVVSHMHFDNYYDLLPLAVVLYNYHTDLFLREDSPFSLEHHVPVPVYLPPGGSTRLQQIMAVVADNSPSAERSLARAFDFALALSDYHPDVPFTCGPFTICAIGPVAHGPGPAFGFRIADGTATLGYTGDSALCDALYDIAHSADLFLCDAMGITNRMRTEQTDRHLTVDDAGRIAFRAGAKQLLLTHIANDSPSWSRSLLEAARTHYDRTIAIARHSGVYQLPLPTDHVR